MYNLNSIPTKSVKDRVSQEAWSCKSRNISHLTNFGCVTYAHTPKEMGRKLDEISEKCILFWYCEEYKSCRLFITITKKYVINRYFEFKEEEAWDGSIDKSVTEGVELSHEHDDGEE